MLRRHLVDPLPRREVCRRGRDVLRAAAVHQVGLPRGGHHRRRLLLLQHHRGALPPVQKGVRFIAVFTSRTELNVPFFLGCFDVVPDKVHMPRQLVAERRLSAVDQRGLQQRQPRESARSAAGEHAKARCVS